MGVSKKITLGVLEVDPQQGTIWLNTPNCCVLRISGLKFSNFKEKFSTIDIRENNVYVESSGLDEDEDKISKIVNEVGLSVHSLFSEENIDPEKLTVYIKDMLQEYKDYYINGIT